MKCVVVPRLIEDAAKSLGMKPLLGFDDNFAYWAASSEEQAEIEIEEAMEMYQTKSDSDDEAKPKFHGMV